MTTPITGEPVHYPVGQKLGMPTRPPLTAEEHKAHAERQRSAAKDTLRRQGKSEAEIAQTFDTLLTTDAHVGRHPAQPVKHQEVEAAKTGKDTDAPDVETIDIHSKTVNAEGEVEEVHTDTLIVEPPNDAARGNAGGSAKLAARINRAVEKKGTAKKIADREDKAADAKLSGGKTDKK